MIVSPASMLWHKYFTSFLETLLMRVAIIYGPILLALMYESHTESY